MMNRIKKVDEYISKAPKEHALILSRLRDLIEATVPESKEFFKWGQPVYSTEKNYCYLKYTKSYVNLGFFDFNKIADTSLLTGTGKRMRHIKIGSVSDIETYKLERIIKQASQF